MFWPAGSWPAAGLAAPGAVNTDTTAGQDCPWGEPGQ